jgi:GNAT superfamily N-acetyltransferase
MATSLRFVVAELPDPADLARLEAEVEAAAVRAAGAGEARDLAIFVRGDDGSIVAGISGVVWGGCCELQAMWVDLPLRRQGLGRALMAAAESEARRRGCVQIVFHAYELLTDRLYERLGYQTLAVVEDFPVGSATRWYRKAL